MKKSTKHRLAAAVDVTVFAIWLITDHWIPLAMLLGLFVLWRARSHLHLARQDHDDLDEEPVFL